MKDIPELVHLYGQGVYTLGEVATAVMCEAATREPEELIKDLPDCLLQEINKSASSLPRIATADDVVVFKSSRAHAEQWFAGAVKWRDYLEGL
jgi:hypothetical protein